MKEKWLSLWETGDTGWHQEKGSAALRKFWPRLAPGSRVLVPLCGKTTDLLWLAGQGYSVTGVELSEIAAQAFFEEAGIHVAVSESDDSKRYESREHHLEIVVGDYFKFADEPFDALYDRASLVALPPQLRPAYVRHTNTLLTPVAAKLLLTLEYDQSMVAGPPFSVLSDEIGDYWPELSRVGELCASGNMPPRFREAGLSEMAEAVWSSGHQSPSHQG